PADGRGLGELLRLQPASRIPHGLAAHGRVEGEDEPPSPAGFGARSKALHLGKESVDLRARGGRCRCAAAIRRWAVVTIIGHYTGASTGRYPAPPTVPIP